MKVLISKDQKIRLLKCIQQGIFDSEIFPELYAYEKARLLTKKEARELWADLDNGEFEKAIPI